MPNGQAHLMVNLAEDEFTTYGAARAEQMSQHSGAVVAGPHAKSVASIRERNAGSLPSSFDTAEPLVFSRCP
jgi:hypothetical protein